MNKKTIFGILIGLLLLSSLIANAWQWKMGKLPSVTEHYSGAMESDHITVKDDKIIETVIDVQTKEVIVTKIVEKVPEGYVKLNLEKYRANMRAFSKLKRKIQELNMVGSESIKVKVDKSVVTEWSDDKLVELKSDLEITKLLNDIDTTATIGIEYQKGGFIFKPSFGIGWDGRGANDNEEIIDIILGSKLFFYNRYNIGTYFYLRGLGVGFGRHLDDLLPLINNAEFRMMPGIRYDGKFNIWLGLTWDL